MKIHEYQAIEIFKTAGIPVAGGRVAVNLPEAQAIAQETGFPVVLKSQVLVGGRGKAGGIKIAKNLEELNKNFSQLKSLVIKGYSVDHILIVRALEIKKEFYAAVTIDNIQGDVVVIASSAGGVDIEDTAKKTPEKIYKYYLQAQKEIDVRQGGLPAGRPPWSDFIKAVFPDPSHQEPATEIFQKLIKLFYQYDCSLAEINPLVIDGTGKFCAADAKINFDDNALYRHPEVQALRDLKYEDPDELEAKKNELSFVKMEGNVGCIVNGAGLAMATMDVIKLLGGDPANFLDVGGSSSPKKVLNALRIILKNKKIKSILINIFGGITRCDDIARGILQAQKELVIPVPLVVRLTGTNEKEAKELLAQNKISTFSSMREAVRRAVELAR